MKILIKKVVDLLKGNAEKLTSEIKKEIIYTVETNNLGTVTEFENCDEVQICVNSSQNFSNIFDLLQTVQNKFSILLEIGYEFEQGESIVEISTKDQAPFHELNCYIRFLRNNDEIYIYDSRVFLDSSQSFLQLALNSSPKVVELVLHRAFYENTNIGDITFKLAVDISNIWSIKKNGFFIAKVSPK